MKMKMRCFKVAVAAMSCVFAVSLHAQEVYHVGNSLTWNAIAGGAVDRMATEQGHSQSSGYHIRWNSALETILNDPDFSGGPGTGKSEGGNHNAALAGSVWDAVTFQPFTKTWKGVALNPSGNGDGATLGGEAASALKMIETTQSNASNDKTRFYMYQAWAPRSVVLTLWNDAVVEDADETLMGVSSEHHRLVYERVKAGTSAEVYLIPAGEVFYRLAQAIEAGELPGYDTYEDLYKDDLHASAELGHYVASVTMFATLYGDDLSDVDSSKLEPLITSFVNHTVVEVMRDNAAVTGWDAQTPEPVAVDP